MPIIAGCVHLLDDTNCKLSAFFKNFTTNIKLLSRTKPTNIFCWWKTK